MTIRAKRKPVRKGLHFRKVSSWVEVGRMPPSKHNPRSLRGPFVACVKIGYGNVRAGNPTNLAACGSGKNPRKAIASALRAAAGKTGARRGAFAGRGT
jgi:hypothetical protein